MKTINKRYDIEETFEYNKENGPFEKIENKNSEIDKFLEKYGIETDFFGFKTKMPLGVASGPLYSVKYMEGACLDGFSVTTWKTFRSVERFAHRNTKDFLGHNIIFIKDKMFDENDINTKIKGSLDLQDNLEKISITNSFGMPSSEPEIWTNEVQEFQKIAKIHNKGIISSVVGTPKDGGDIYDLAEDYAFTACIAEKCGSKIIELNFSCPNVCGSEGSIYKDIQNSKIILEKVKKSFANKDTKLLIKLGPESKQYFRNFLRENAQFLDGIVAINTIPMQVVDEKGNQALPGGLKSGVCGHCILNEAVKTVNDLSNLKKELNLKIKIIGCGGVTSPESVMKHIEAGAEFVMVGTAALFNPNLPLDFAKYMNKEKISLKI